MKFKRSDNMVKRYTRSTGGNIVILLLLLLSGSFMLLPMIYSVLTSLKPLEEIMAFPPRFFVVRPTIQNYLTLSKLVSNLWVPFSRYLFNSVFVSVVTTALHVIIASAAAFVFSKYSRYQIFRILFLVVQFSLLYTAFTLSIPQYVIFAKMQILNTYLVYILPYIPSALGVFLMKQYMDESVPDTLMESAKIDGASSARIFWQIVMPMVKPAWMTLILFAFRDIWSAPSSSTVFNEELKLLPNVMGQIVNGGIPRMGSAMAANVLMMIPPIVVYIVSQSNVIETLSSSGIKD